MCVEVVDLTGFYNTKAVIDIPQKTHGYWGESVQGFSLDRLHCEVCHSDGDRSTHSRTTGLPVEMATKRKTSAGQAEF